MLSVGQTQRENMELAPHGWAVGDFAAGEGMTRKRQGPGASFKSLKTPPSEPTARAACPLQHPQPAPAARPAQPAQRHSHGRPQARQVLGSNVLGSRSCARACKCPTTLGWVSKPFLQALWTPPSQKQWHKDLSSFGLNNTFALSLQLLP